MIKAKDGEKIGDKVTVGVRARYDVYDLYTDSRVLYSSYESFYLTAIIPGQYRGLDCRERLVADLAKDKFDLTIKKHYTGVTDSDIEAILDIDPKAISVITPPSGIRETSQRYAYKSTHFLLADDTAYHPAGERPIKCVQSMPESAFVGFVIGCVHREGISDSIDYGLTVSDSSRPLLVEAPDMTDVAADLKKHLEWLRGQVDWCYARWWQGIDGASGEKLVGRIKALEKILDDAKEAAKRLE
ncbi:MAG: hypothetical protein NT157_05695 [Candidatus Micrarchaeota archaeon]|nr:hypothetical protein [Candidatus Micrarchaeota archaeon]